MYAAPCSEWDLLELYCGNGNFTVPLAANFRRVVATEVSKASVTAAQHNMKVSRVLHPTEPDLTAGTISVEQLHAPCGDQTLVSHCLNLCRCLPFILQGLMTVYVRGTMSTRTLTLALVLQQLSTSGAGTRYNMLQVSTLTPVQPFAQVNGVTNFFVGRMSSEEFTAAWLEKRAMRRMEGACSASHAPGLLVVGKSPADASMAAVTECGNGVGSLWLLAPGVIKAPNTGRGTKRAEPLCCTQLAFRGG